MDGVNPDTVWTWNAIGKRSGAWNLVADSPEFTQGLPAQPPDLRTAARPDGGYDHANADPITGQAAWYDLRVRIEKAPAAEAGLQRAALRDACATRPRWRRRPRSCAIGARPWRRRSSGSAAE